MITIYMTSSCPSCRKAKKWLEANNLPYTVRNISSELITKEEIKTILLMTEEGTEEIISTRSKAYQELDMDLEALSLKELYTVISENPGVLRRPILIDNKRLQIGYNEEEIRRFLPRSVRTLELQQLLKIV